MNIILTGLARSGKDSVANFLAQKYGFKKYVLSDVLSELLKKQGKAVTKANMALLGDELRAAEGQEAVARRLMSKINERDDVVVVGARSMAEVDFLKRKLENAVLVRIDSAPGKRFERKSRQDPANEEAFFARDENDLKSKGMAKVLENADYAIQNNSSIIELREKITGFIEKFK